MAPLRITARMYIGAPAGRLGLRGAASRRSATWPLGPFGLGATSHTCPRYAKLRMTKFVTCPELSGSSYVEARA